MNSEAIMRLNAVLTALNSVTVSGKNNLTNLAGSISIIEGVVELLQATPES